jgi:hypothetical protein
MKIKYGIRNAPEIRKMKLMELLNAIQAEKLLWCYEKVAKLSYIW